MSRLHTSNKGSHGRVYESDTISASEFHPDGMFVCQSSNDDSISDLNDSTMSEGIENPPEATTIESIERLSDNTVTGTSKKPPKSERQRESRRLRQFDRRRAKRLRKKKEQSSTSTQAQIGSIAEHQTRIFDDRSWKVLELLYFADVGLEHPNSLSECDKHVVETYTRESPSLFLTPNETSKFCELRDREIVFLQRLYQKVPGAILNTRQVLKDCQQVLEALPAGVEDYGSRVITSEFTMVPLNQLRIAEIIGRASQQLTWLQHHLGHLPRVIGTIKATRARARAAARSLSHRSRAYLDFSLSWNSSFSPDTIFEIEMWLGQAVPYTPVYADLQARLERQFFDTWTLGCKLSELCTWITPKFWGEGYFSFLSPWVEPHYEVSAKLAAVEEAITRLTLLQASQIIPARANDQGLHFDTIKASKNMRIGTKGQGQGAGQSYGSTSLADPNKLVVGYQWVLKAISQAEPGYIWSSTRCPRASEDA